MARAWDVVERSAAAPETVWTLLADARGWPQWARFTHAHLEREGVPAPDGVGAIRVFGGGPVRSAEEVVEFEPPHRLAYELRRGLPVVGYRADVTLEPEGAGTRITWSSRFERGRVPGSDGFVEWFLRRFLTDTAKRLARAAEAR